MAAEDTRPSFLQPTKAQASREQELACKKRSSIRRDSAIDGPAGEDTMGRRCSTSRRASSSCKTWGHPTRGSPTTDVATVATQAMAVKKVASDEDPDGQGKTPRFKTYNSQMRGQYTTQQCLKTVPLFQRCSSEFVEMLAEQVTTQIFDQGCDIVTQGEIGDRMYVLNRGRVEIVVHGTIVASLSDGSLFGEMAAICKNSAAARRTATVRSKTICDCRVILRDDLLTTLKRFKEDEAIIEAEARSRLQDLRAKGVIASTDLRSFRKNSSCSSPLPDTIAGIRRSHKGSLGGSLPRGSFAGKTRPPSQGASNETPENDEYAVSRMVSDRDGFEEVPRSSSTSPRKLNARASFSGSWSSPRRCSMPVSKHCPLPPLAEAAVQRLLERRRSHSLQPKTTASAAAAEKDGSPAQTANDSTVTQGSTPRSSSIPCPLSDARRLEAPRVPRAIAHPPPQRRGRSFSGTPGSPQDPSPDFVRLDRRGTFPLSPCQPQPQPLPKPHEGTSKEPPLARGLTSGHLEEPPSRAPSCGQPLSCGRSSDCDSADEALTRSQSPGSQWSSGPTKPAVAPQLPIELTSNSREPHPIAAEEVHEASPSCRQRCQGRSSSPQPSRADVTSDASTGEVAAEESEASGSAADGESPAQKASSITKEEQANGLTDCEGDSEQEEGLELSTITEASPRNAESEQASKTRAIAATVSWHEPAQEQEDEELCELSEDVADQTQDASEAIGHRSSGLDAVLGQLAPSEEAQTPEVETPESNENAAEQPSQAAWVEPSTSDEEAAEQPGQAEPATSDEDTAEQPSQVEPARSNENTPEQPSQVEPATSNESAVEQPGQVESAERSKDAEEQPSQAERATSYEEAAQHSSQVSLSEFKAGLLRRAATSAYGRDSPRRFHTGRPLNRVQVVAGPIPAPSPTPSPPPRPPPPPAVELEAPASREPPAAPLPPLAQAPQRVQVSVPSRRAPPAVAELLAAVGAGQRASSASSAAASSAAPSSPHETGSRLPPGCTESGSAASPRALSTASRRSVVGRAAHTQDGRVFPSSSLDIQQDPHYLVALAAAEAAAIAAASTARPEEVPLRVAQAAAEAAATALVAPLKEEDSRRMRLPALQAKASPATGRSSSARQVRPARRTVKAGFELEAMLTQALKAAEATPVGPFSAREANRPLKPALKPGLKAAKQQDIQAPTSPKLQQLKASSPSEKTRRKQPFLGGIPDALSRPPNQRRV